MKRPAGQSQVTRNKKARINIVDAGSGFMSGGLSDRRFCFGDAESVEHLHKGGRNLIGIMAFDLVPMDHLNKLPIAHQRKGRR